MIRPLRRAHGILSVVLFVVAVVLMATALVARLPRLAPSEIAPMVQP